MKLTYSAMEFMQLLLMRILSVIKLKHPLRYALILMLGILSVNKTRTCVAQTAESSFACQHSTVDDLGDKEYAKKAKHFLVELQKTVKADQQGRFAAFVQYPAYLFKDGQRSTLVDSDDFLNRYSSIITPDVKIAITDQPLGCLFANSQGVMIGNGTIWYQEQPGGQMKIVTFNLSTVRSPQ